MRVILLLFVLFKSVISNDESDEKYIDLLPEEEKRQFLEKIARRIFEDYQNNNEPNASHVELSDDELDAHSAYVQGLLQEETHNLREERNKEPQRRDDKEEYTNVDENNRKNSVESEKSFADLTLRSGKRAKRNNTNKEHNTQEYDVIPVLPIYDQKEIIHNNSSRSKNTTEPPSTTTEKKYLENITKNETFQSDNLFNITGSSNVLRNSFMYDEEREDDPENDHDVEDRLKSTVIDNFEPNTQESNDELSKESTIEETTSDLSLGNTTTSVSSWLQNIREGNLTRKENNESLEFIDNAETSSDLVTLVSKKQGSTTTITSSTQNAEFITMNNITSNAYMTNTSTGDLKSIDMDYDDYAFTTVSFNAESTKSVSTETPAKVESLNIKSVPTVLTTNAPTTVKLDKISKATSNLASNIKPVTNNFYETDNSTNTTTIEHLDIELNRTNTNDINIFDARKKTPLRKIVKSEETIIKDIKTIESIEIPTNDDKSVYYVYEVSAEKPPFQSTDDHENHPYYAPVYNYAPEFAYYNPYNRLGPNIDDINKDLDEKTNNTEKSLSSEKRRNRYKNAQSTNNNQNKWNSMSKVLKNQKQFNIIKPPHVVPSSANFNPNDYIDMDYFFGRLDNNLDIRSGKGNNGAQKSYFPDTNESEHPHRSIQNSLQSHIRAVRKLLYDHKQFGYIPERLKLSSEDDIKKLRTKDLTLYDIFNVKKSRNKDDITMDYYFGRKHSHEEGSEHQKLFKLKLDQLKDMFTITPNPIEDKINKNAEEKEKEAQKDNDIEVMVNVLRDMIKMDNDELVKYDWLGSTVDIQSALSKLTGLTKQLKNGDHIHPDDFELLKYVIYLYKSTNQSNETTISIELLKDTINKLRNRIKKKSLIPKIKKKKKKFASAITMWRNFRTFLRSLINVQNDKKEMLRQFEDFVDEIQFNLNDLHDAIKHIAAVTTYENQRWYTDLKDLYLKEANRKALLEVILHLSLSRLLELIEESSKNGLEDNFSDFVKKNRKEVDATKELFQYVLRLLNEFRS